MQKHFAQIHETQSWRVDAHKLTLIICHNGISENEKNAVEIHSKEFWPLSPLIICQYLCLHMKTVCWWFHIKRLFTFLDMRAYDMWKVWLQTFKNDRISSKLAHSLRNLQNSRANNSRIPWICFYMDTNI